MDSYQRTVGVLCVPEEILYMPCSFIFCTGVLEDGLDLYDNICTYSVTHVDS